MASPLPLPLRGWSTWNTFRCDVSAQLLNESILSMAESPLKAAGYDYILLDDCWTLCLDEHPATDRCGKAGPRDAQGRIQVSPKKFPDGFAPLTQLAHDHGLKMGICA